MFIYILNSNTHKVHTHKIMTFSSFSIVKEKQYYYFYYDKQKYNYVGTGAVCDYFSFENSDNIYRVVYVDKSYKNQIKGMIISYIPIKSNEIDWYQSTPMYIHVLVYLE